MDALRAEGKIRCRTLWISDVHLGSSHCKADNLIKLLKQVHCKQIYLVGDIVDLWAMKRRVHWPEAHNQVLRQLLKKSKAGVEVIYIPGNHDANFREFCGSEFGNVKVRREVIHNTADGRQFLVIHGDELDHAVRYSRINRLIGDHAYDGLMVINAWVNRLRELMGKPYWSLAKWAKSRVGKAAHAISAYQEAAVSLVRHRKLDGIICGHLHYPLIKQYDDVLYCNDGDWVDNCTAMVEDANGELHLIQAIAGKVPDAELIVAAV